MFIGCSFFLYIEKRYASRPQPLLSFDAPSSSQQPSKPLIGAVVPQSPAFTSSEQYAADDTTTKPFSHLMQQKQQRPKPLINFSNSMTDPPVKDNMHNNDVDMDDDEPILLKKPNYYQHRSHEVKQPSSSTITDSSSSSSGNNNKSPVPTSPTPKNLMDRMKERHRMEARRSLQPSPFTDTARSPSVPNLLAITNEPVVTNIKAQRPLVQSHSFTVYNNSSNSQPLSPIMKRPVGNMVKSMSLMNDLDATLNQRPIQVPTLIHFSSLFQKNSNIVYKRYSLISFSEKTQDHYP